MPRHRCIGERGWTFRALWLGKPCVAEAAYTLDPVVVGFVELTQRFLGSAREFEGGDIGRRSTEVGPFISAKPTIG